MVAQPLMGCAHRLHVLLRPPSSAARPALGRRYGQSIRVKSTWQRVCVLSWRGRRVARGSRGPARPPILPARRRPLPLTRACIRRSAKRATGFGSSRAGSGCPRRRCAPGSVAGAGLDQLWSRRSTKRCGAPPSPGPRRRARGCARSRCLVRAGQGGVAMAPILPVSPPARRHGRGGAAHGKRARPTVVRPVTQAGTREHSSRRWARDWPTSSPLRAALRRALLPARRGHRPRCGHLGELKRATRSADRARSALAEPSGAIAARGVSARRATGGPEPAEPFARPVAGVLAGLESATAVTAPGGRRALATSRSVAGSVRQPCRR